MERGCRLEHAVPQLTLNQAQTAWVDGPALHHGRAAGAAAVVGNKIVVIGGRTAGSTRSRSRRQHRLRHRRRSQPGHNASTRTLQILTFHG